MFELLYERVKLGQPASEGDVEGAIAESAYQGLLFPGDEGTSATASASSRPASAAS